MTAVASPEMDSRIVAAARALESSLGGVVLGKAAQVRLATAALMSGEHLLVNDLPGVGKTTLAAALAKVVDGSFGRVQGTPDVLTLTLGVTVGVRLWNALLGIPVWLVLIVAAFRVSVAQGLLTLLVPGYAIYFVYGVSRSA